ncbi:MAG TPA: glycosyltransferase family 39 protein [Gemmataceae bacterium]|nr:glycosyltransferase family 39 protein [Gemmataceae bacterium]
MTRDTAQVGADGPTPTHTPATPTRGWPVLLFRLTVLAVVALAVWWRVPVTTEWPVKFQRALQYDSALAARTIWLTLRPGPRSPLEAAWLEKAPGRFIEPPLLQTLTVLTYFPDGRERPWVSGLIASAFWLLGGWFLYRLALWYAGGAGALCALAYYLLAPFGIVVSQSFQPEALLVCGLLGALWVLVCGRALESWQRTLVAGLVCGLALLVKPGVVLLPLAGAFLAYSVRARGWRGTLLSGQSYLFGLLAAAPSVLWTLALLRGQVGGKMLPQLLLSPRLYAGWAANMQTVVGGVPLALGIAGALLSFLRRPAPLGVGLLLGFLANGLLFTFHTMTHDYYQVPLIPIVALSAAPLAQVGFDALARQVPRWAGLPGAVLFLAAGAALAQPATDLAGPRFPEWPAQYEAVADAVGPGTEVLSLSESYGLPLTYHGWVFARFWPSQGDQEYDELLSGAARGEEAILDSLIEQERPRYFVITQVEWLPRHPGLAMALKRRYPVLLARHDLVIYDLRSRRDRSESDAASP